MRKIKEVRNRVIAFMGLLPLLNPQFNIPLQELLQTDKQFH